MIFCEMTKLISLQGNKDYKMEDSRVVKHLNSRLFALEETQNKANEGVFYARKKGLKLKRS